MVRGIIEACRPLLAFGEEPLLSKSEILMIGVAAAIAAVVVFIALLVRVRRRGTRTEVDSCHQCGSMNVQNRAGLVVCVDCGYSVKTAEAEA